MSDEEALTAKLGVLDNLITEEIVLTKAPALKLEVASTELDSAYAEAKKNITDAAFQQELTRRNAPLPVEMKLDQAPRRASNPWRPSDLSLSI